MSRTSPSSHRTKSCGMNAFYAMNLTGSGAKMFLKNCRLLTISKVVNIRQVLVHEQTKSKNCLLILVNRWSFLQKGYVLKNKFGFSVRQLQVLETQNVAKLYLSIVSKTCFFTFKFLSFKFLFFEHFLATWQKFWQKYGKISFNF